MTPFASCRYSHRCIVCSASIGQSPALTSQPKTAVMSPNITAILQVPEGRPLGLRLPVVELISGCSPWAVDSEDSHVSFLRLLLGSLFNLV